MSLKNIILLFFTLMCCFISSESFAACDLKGDINCDGKIGLEEAVYALQVLAGLKPSTPAVMQITSTAFSDNENIPVKYACNDKGGQNISPALSWTNIPQNTVSLAIIVYDPHATAENFVHWVLYGISPNVTSISEGIPTGSTVNTTIIPGGAKQIANMAGTIGYFGPCPPDPPHPYIFTLYALDSSIDFTSGNNDLQSLLDAIKGHILAQAQITGNF